MSSRQAETEIDHHIPRGDEELKFWFKEPYQSIATRRETNHNQRALHKHDFIELAIVLASYGVHLIEQTRHPIGPGDTFVIPPNIRHGYADTQSLSLINIPSCAANICKCWSASASVCLALCALQVGTARASHGPIQWSTTTLTAGSKVEIEDWIESLEAATRETTPQLAPGREAFYS